MSDTLATPSAKIERINLIWTDENDIKNRVLCSTPGLSRTRASECVVSSEHSIYRLMVCQDIQAALDTGRRLHLVVGSTRVLMRL